MREESGRRGGGQRAEETPGSRGVTTGQRADGRTRRQTLSEGSRTKEGQIKETAEEGRRAEEAGRRVDDIGCVKDQ